MNMFTLKDVFENKRSLYCKFQNKNVFVLSGVGTATVTLCVRVARQYQQNQGIFLRSLLTYLNYLESRSIFLLPM